MELGQVEAFVEANRRGSISRAADALGLTQPTCTARLHGLERELGAQLLVRGRRGVSLTPAGRRLLPRAIAAMDSLRRGATGAKRGSEAPGGLLAIGLANTEACKRVVLSGLGAALLPEMAIRAELGRGDLVQLRVEGHPPPKRAIHALTRQGAELSAAANALLRLVG